MNRDLVRTLLCAGAFALLALTAAACGSSDETTTTTEVAEQVTNPRVEAVVADYRDYLQENADELVATTEPFVAAVVAGDLAEAKALYAAPRIPYERIEPVADSFGALDPKIDARENDVAAGQFEGFHRIEKALWEEGTTDGMAPVAEQLQRDVEALAEKVKGVELQPVQIAEGANGLLGEVSASKITGEEERYSHIDLVDFEANVEGSETAFEAVKPLLDETDPDLAAEIESHFKAVFNSLEPYRTEDGFVLYTELTRADTKKLAVAIDTLAEKLSLVPAAIASSEHE
jgi:iron uptake system component EfeO